GWLMLWYICIGLLLIIMTMITASLEHLPLTAAILYLCFGIVLGPSIVGLIHLNFLAQTDILVRLTEVAVIVSLFTAGLKLRLPLSAREWRVPFLLASVSMIVSVALTAMASYFLFSVPLGAAILLGAIVAPTDPVLAASVQVLGPEDRDKLRFSLTAEAGLNDGTAFPFVMLGLGLLGLRDLGDYGWRWILIDVVWSICGGLAIGTFLATCISKLILYLRRKSEETQGLDDFLALGLICLTYGVALWLNVYGFLAVFAAGLALRRGERQETQGLDRVEDENEQRPWQETVSAHMAHGVLKFNEQLERLGEIIVVLVLGSMLFERTLSLRSLCLAAAIFLVIRPLSVGLVTQASERSHRRLISWFGIRGVGTVYYLAYAIGQGVSGVLADQLIQATLTVITASIVLHGVTSAPLMMRYSRGGLRSK
ncbi:MAG: cation:proton antiporter, partial [Bdellovibrionia bacterium]